MPNPKHPNIVIFFVDDMGYGDVSCLNPNGKIPTPNFDRLSQEGMVFTDAHSTSAVCSPSRYGLLTGRYNWRTSLQSGIVKLYGDPLIDQDRVTVPSFLKKHGYHTGCIGKWHLGMGWDFEVTKDFIPDGDKYNAKNYPSNHHATEAQKALWQEAFSKPTTGGPTTRGFDYYFGVDVPNWPPYCFIENDRTVGTPSEFLPARLLGNNQASTPGPAMPYWHFEQLLPTWAEKADTYITERATNDEPFFLYLPMTSPHTPLSVNTPWIGKSGLNNLYADLVMETDDIFGQVLTSLEENGLTDNTLVIFTSDNGCAHYIGTDMMEAQGHYPSANYRGYKSDAWDGGHRMPCIARWPGTIEPGSTSNQLVCLSDLLATCADIVNATLPDAAGEDSISWLPLFQGTENPIRSHVIHHSIQGKFAIRDNHWKLVLSPGSGGWSKNDAQAAQEGLPLVQLYNLSTDPEEQHNLHNQHPQKVREMITLLEKLIADGRSTPGKPQQNDAPIDIWKFDTMPAADPKALDDY
ncbi:MAG: arylsulfatase [Candidatus Latescibacteria bacterium]|nr:arylsulfatase [Candidatus Latescibacterota bacterium]